MYLALLLLLLEPIVWSFTVHSHIRETLLSNEEIPHKFTLITAFILLKDPIVCARIHTLAANLDSCVSPTAALIAASHAWSNREPLGSLIYLKLRQTEDSATAVAANLCDSDCPKFRQSDFLDFVFAAETARRSVSPEMAEISVLLWTALAAAEYFGAAGVLAESWRRMEEPKFCSLDLLQYNETTFSIGPADECVSAGFSIRNSRNCQVDFSDSKVTAEFAPSQFTKHREFGKVGCLSFARLGNCVACMELHVRGRRGLHLVLREISDHKTHAYLNIVCPLGRDPEICALAAEAAELERLNSSNSEEDRLRGADLRMETGKDWERGLAEYWSLFVNGSSIAVRLAAGVSLMCSVLESW